MHKRINIIFYSLFVIYLILGIILSINTGVSHDELHEQTTWQVNLKAIKSFFVDNNGYEELLVYKDRYFGIAFHLLTQPIQFLTYEFVSDINKMSDNDAYLVSRHISFFTIFTISGIFFYKLCLKISNNSNFSLFSSSIYLLYPYLFGHALMNTKDIPVLSFWLICSYLSLSIFENYLIKEKFDIKKIILLSFLTSFLVSIRLVGALIFIQYFISLFIILDIKKINLLQFLTKNLKILSLFISLFFLFLYSLNPILWKNPLELINGFLWFSKYKIAVCTLTLGECMDSLNITYKYYFIWLFFKLPILILFGFLLFPFVEKKLFTDNKTKLYYSTFLITTLSILLLLILMRVAIYDELRHIMFLIPLIFIISLYNFFKFNKKLFYTISSIVIFIFVTENFKLNPYQYTWLNNFARYINIQKNFELDYWGISSKNLQQTILKISKEENIDNSVCIYGDMYNGAYLRENGFNCFKSYSSIDEPVDRPYFAYQNTRNLKRSDPKDCSLIHVEKYNYFLINQDLVMGEIWYCD